MRALAVISVIAFHWGVPGFTGGYVGVDVFFVISGYLITQMLMQAPPGTPFELLSSFYARRARRILPALLVMCAITAVIGAWLLLPYDLMYLGKYLTTTPVFLSNVAARTMGGYFGWARSQPLQHLWSIAVEEQYYLVYPLVLFGLGWFAPRFRLATLAAGAALSFALCVWASDHRPDANYYYASSRAWELLLGALLALAPLPALRSRAMNEVLAAASLLLIAGVVCLYDSSTPFPGTYALVPCLATAGLIATGRGTGVTTHKLLALRPLVFIGLISYSLYLWHRPLQLLAAYYHIVPLSAIVRTGMLAATLLCATISWGLIEVPVRRRLILQSNRSLAAAAVAASAVVLITGAVFWYTSGLPQRFTPAVRAQLSEYDENSPIVIHCVDQPPAALLSGGVCEFGQVQESPARKILLWGDSHALMLVPAFESLSNEHGARLYFVARSSCPPLLGVADQRCTDFNAAVMSAIARIDPDTIILAGHWSGSPAMPESLVISSLRRTLAASIADGRRRVCLVLDVPLQKPINDAVVRAQLRGIDDGFLAISREEALAPLRSFEQDVRALPHEENLTVVDPKDVLCAGASCLYKAQGAGLYYDGNHLSRAGAIFVAPVLERCLAAG